METPGSNSYFGTPGQGIGGQPDYILAKGGGGGGKEPLMEDLMVVLVVVLVAATQVQYQMVPQLNQEQTQVLLYQIMEIKEDSLLQLVDMHPLVVVERVLLVVILMEI